MHCIDWAAVKLGGKTAPTVLTTKQVFCVPTNVLLSYGYWESHPGHRSALVTLLTVPSNTDSFLIRHPPLHTGSVLVSPERKATACLTQLFKAGALDKQHLGFSFRDMFSTVLFEKIF